MNIFYLLILLTFSAEIKGKQYAQNEQTYYCKRLVTTKIYQWRIYYYYILYF